MLPPTPPLEVHMQPFSVSTASWLLNAFRVCWQVKCLSQQVFHTHMLRCMVLRYSSTKWLWTELFGGGSLLLYGPTWSLSLATQHVLYE